LKLILVKIDDMKYRNMIKEKIRKVKEEMENRPKYLSGKNGQLELNFHEDMEDMVNHPPHYNKNGIETIDAIESATGEGFEYYLQGNILKYLWRYRYKNGAEDLKKARWYLDKLTKITEEREENDHVRIK